MKDHLRKPKPQKCSVITTKSVSDHFVKQKICMYSINTFSAFSPRILPLPACLLAIMLHLAEVVLLLIYWECTYHFTPLDTYAFPDTLGFLSLFASISGECISSSFTAREISSSELLFFILLR